MVLPILARSQKFRFFPPAFLICCQFSNTSPLGSEVTVTPIPTWNNVITSVTSLVTPSSKGKEKVSSQIDPISLPGILKKKVIISVSANEQGSKRKQLGFAMVLPWFLHKPVLIPQLAQSNTSLAQLIWLLLLTDFCFTHRDTCAGATAIGWELMGESIGFGRPFLSLHVWFPCQWDFWGFLVLSWTRQICNTQNLVQNVMSTQMFWQS